MTLPFADRPIPTSADLEQSIPVVAAAIAGAAQGSEEPYAPGMKKGHCIFTSVLDPPDHPSANAS